MKKTLLTLLTLGITSTILSAQNINTGTIEVNGDVSFGFGSQEKEINGNDTDTDVMGLSLNALYYVAPNLGVGLHWE